MTVFIGEAFDCYDVPYPNKRDFVAAQILHNMIFFADLQHGTTARDGRLKAWSVLQKIYPDAAPDFIHLLNVYMDNDALSTIQIVNDLIDHSRQNANILIGQLKSQYITNEQRDCTNRITLDMFRGSFARESAIVKKKQCTITTPIGNPNLHYIFESCRFLKYGFVGRDFVLLKMMIYLMTIFTGI